MVKKSLILMISLVMLVTACQPVTAVPTSEPAVAIATETLIPPTKTPVPPTTTNTNKPEPTATVIPTPLPYYLEDETLYDLDEETGEYVVVSEGVSSLETSDDGVLAAKDEVGKVLAQYSAEEGEWKEVIAAEPEAFALGVNETEIAALNEFIAGFDLVKFKEQLENGEVIGLNFTNEAGEDLGPVEYGVITQNWEDVPDEMLPNYAERFEMVSMFVVGAGVDGEGIDFPPRKMIGVIPSEDLSRFAFVFIDTLTDINAKSNIISSSGIASDRSLLWYSGDGVSGVTNEQFVSNVKSYLDDGGMPFQVVLSIDEVGDGNNQSTHNYVDDLQDVVHGKRDNLQPNRYSLFYSWDAWPAAIFVPNQVITSLGY